MHAPSIVEHAASHRLGAILASGGIPRLGVRVRGVGVLDGALADVVHRFVDDGIGSEQDIVRAPHDDG
jgi:hypothetical protein